MLDECQLLAAKPVLFVANVSEGANADEAMVKTVREFAEKRGARVVTICGQLEAELSTLPDSERADYLKEMGLIGIGPCTAHARSLRTFEPHHLLYCRRNKVASLADSERAHGPTSCGQDPLRYGTRIHPRRSLSL